MLGNFHGQGILYNPEDGAIEQEGEFRKGVLVRSVEKETEPETTEPISTEEETQVSQAEEPETESESINFQSPKE